MNQIYPRSTATTVMKDVSLLIPALIVRFLNAFTNSQEGGSAGNDGGTVIKKLLSFIPDVIII